MTQPLEPILIPKLQPLKSNNANFWEQPREMGVAMVSGPCITSHIFSLSIQKVSSKY
jgi:hypothetical protein